MEEEGVVEVEGLGVEEWEKKRFRRVGLVSDWDGMVGDMKEGDVDTEAEADEDDEMEIGDRAWDWNRRRRVGCDGDGDGVGDGVGELLDMEITGLGWGIVMMGGRLLVTKISWVRRLNGFWGFGWGEYCMREMETVQNVAVCRFCNGQFLNKIVCL